MSAGYCRCRSLSCTRSHRRSMLAVSRGEISDLWFTLARRQEANGDRPAAAQSRANARVFRQPVYPGRRP